MVSRMRSYFRLVLGNLSSEGSSLELALTRNMCRRIFFHSRVGMDGMYVQEGSHCF